MSENAIVEVRNLSKEFGSGIDKVRAVDDVSFAVCAGETLGLAGISGSGKSVIGRMIVSLTKPSRGEILFENVPITNLRRRQLLQVRARMQMVFQNPLTAFNPRKTAGSSLELPLINFGLGGARERKERVADLLAMVGLSPRHAQYYPHEFSGGQCQRLGIARALASNPRFVFLDEPVSALDVSIQAQILNLLKDLQDRLGLTYLFVANNLNVLYFVSDRIAVLHRGRIIEVQDGESLFRSPQHAVTRDLLSAIVPYEARRATPPRSHGRGSTITPEHPVNQQP